MHVCVFSEQDSSGGKETQSLHPSSSSSLFIILVPTRHKRKKKNNNKCRGNIETNKTTAPPTASPTNQPNQATKPLTYLWPVGRDLEVKGDVGERLLVGAGHEGVGQHLAHVRPRTVHQVRAYHHSLFDEARRGEAASRRWRVCACVAIKRRAVRSKMRRCSAAQCKRNANRVWG